jgi:hypothetical protein
MADACWVVAVIAVGMLLMVGGRSNDPNSFNYDEVYSTLGSVWLLY